MQVAARGPAGGANTRDDLARPHGVARTDADGLKVVVGGDETIAVIDFHAVTATPGMPAGSAYNTGVSRVDGGPAGRCIILAQVEITGSPADGTDPETERRTRIKKLQRGHQKAGAGPAHACGPYSQRPVSALDGTPYCRMREGQGDQRIGLDGRRNSTRAHLVRRRLVRFPARLLVVVPRGGSTRNSCTLGAGPGSCSRQLHPLSGAGRKVYGTNRGRQHPCSGHGAGNRGKGTLVRLPVAGH